jgi:hypothetical protein
MANFAVIKENIVQNVVVADTIEIAQEVTGQECIECDGSFWIGWTRSGDIWTAPEEPTEDPA